MADLIATWSWGGDVHPNEQGITEGEFKLRREEMRQAIGPDTRWLEVHFPSCRRRISVEFARRMAEVRGVYVCIPWRCWQRIDSNPQPLVELSRRQSAKSKARASREDAGQETMLGSCEGSG